MNGDSDSLYLVTGGTRGIGRAIALRLARQGKRVAALYARNREAAESLEAAAKSEGLSLKSHRVDLTSAEAVESCVKEINDSGTAVGAIIHSAASGVHRPVSDLTARHLEWTFAVNVVGAHRLIQGLNSRLGAGSRIIGITSSGGTRALPQYGAIGASKGALESLFRHYAREMAPRGIAVNLVCPGLVATEALDAFPERERMVREATDRTPSGRVTSAEDVAALVAFLCAPESGQIIGQTLVVDGGRSLVG